MRVLLALALVWALCSASVAPTSWKTQVAIPAAPCDSFQCGDYSRQSDGRGACALPVVIVAGWQDVSVTQVVLELSTRSQMAGFCSNITGVNVAGVVGSVQQWQLRAVRDDKRLLGYQVLVSFATAVTNPVVSVSFSCVDALQHYNVYLDNRVVAHMYTLMLSQSFSRTLDPRVEIVMPGALDAAQLQVAPAAVAAQQRNGTTLFAFDALEVESFVVALAFSFDAVYARCSTSWWYSESTMMRYGIVGGVIVGATCIAAAVVWVILKKCIKRKVNTRSYVSEMDVLDMDDMANAQELFSRPLPEPSSNHHKKRAKSAAPLVAPAHLICARSKAYPESGDHDATASGHEAPLHVVLNIDAYLGALRKSRGDSDSPLLLTQWSQCVDLPAAEQEH